MDVLTPEQRSYCMSRIRGKDTEPELVVRKLLTVLGYRYRLHVKGLPGRPDIVLPKAKKAIFVHGCFWHRHNCRYGRPFPKRNKRFWHEKFDSNRRRDQRVKRKLRREGWSILTIWECRTRVPERTLVTLQKFL